jgi:glc operon protein GlcG
LFAAWRTVHEPIMTCIARAMGDSSTGSAHADRRAVQRGVLISGGSLMRHMIITPLLLSAALVAGPALAQQPAASPPAPPPAYGESIDIEQAKKVAATAVAEAKKINTFMAISVVSPSGDLVYFEKMDNTQYASINIAIHKARTAATFRRPTLSFEERVSAGGAGITLLTLDGIIASPGGNPIIIGGKLVGAIGVSGGTGAQDNQVSLAGLGALK